MDNKNTPSGVRVVDDPVSDYYIVAGIFKNFDGFTKANFVGDASILSKEAKGLSNFKLQDYFFGAHKFDDVNKAIKIANMYYEYYGTKSDLFAVYGINQDDTQIIWYQDGFYEYIGESKSIHGDNWFYGAIGLKEIRETFNKGEAPIFLTGKELSVSSVLNDIGVFPRESVIVQYESKKDNTVPIMYYFNDPRSLDTTVSRLARLYSVFQREKYEGPKVKKAKARAIDILRRAPGHYKLGDYARNEREVPRWIRGIARYGISE